MKIIAFDGSPRKNGNSTILLKKFLERTEKHGASVCLYKNEKLNLKPCRGCLICNKFKRCVMRDDDWEKLSAEILEADVIAFATPVYFHHTTSSMKKLIDRFRSFINVQITEESLIHTPHQKWNKKFVLFTAHGSSSEEDAMPVIDLFDFIIKTLGEGNELNIITAVRLALEGQIAFTTEQLEAAYKKLGLPQKLAAEDYKRNSDWLLCAEDLADKIVN